MQNQQNSVELGPDILDIRDIFILSNEWFWILITMLFVLLGIGIFFAFYITKRRRKSKIVVLSPFEQAMQEIDLAKKAILSLESRTLAIVLSQAIRVYIEKVLFLPAPELTTEEFLTQIAQNNYLSAEEIGSLKTFLETCDLAKFAKCQFVKMEAQKLCENASDFVDLVNKKQESSLAKSTKTKN